MTGCKKGYMTPVLPHSLWWFMLFAGYLLQPVLAEVALSLKGSFTARGRYPTRTQSVKVEKQSFSNSGASASLQLSL